MIIFLNLGFSITTMTGREGIMMCGNGTSVMPSSFLTCLEITVLMTLTNLWTFV